MAKKKQDNPTIEDIDKMLSEEHGSDLFSFGSDKEPAGRIPTGIMSVDKMLGGGIPRGRITEIFGKESSSKTLLLLCTIAQAQKEGGKCVFVDLEKSFDPIWAKKHGVNLETLRIIEPRDGDQAWEIIESYLSTGDVDVLGVDSVAQIVPRAELEGEMSQANIGLAARLNSKAMRKITSLLGARNNRTALVLINQTRQNVTTGPAYGNPTVTSGGKAIPFYAVLRLNMARIQKITSGNDVVGATFRIKTEKAKLTGVRPFATCMFDVDFDHGADIAKDVLVYAVAAGLCSKRGAWFSYQKDGEEIKMQGEIAMKEHMRETGLLDIWKEQLLNTD